MQGSSTTVPSTPKMTPLLMTTPRSRPKVKLMKQMEIKPATVVRLEPKMEVKVRWMALAMASSRSSVRAFCSL